MHKRQKTGHNSQDAPAVSSTGSGNKRRRPTDQAPPTSTKSTQPTISELFSANTKPIDTSNLTPAAKLAQTPPKNKRQKFQHSSPASVTSDHLVLGSMYAFPTRPRSNASQIVDLTSSPTASPKRPTPRPNLHPELGARKIVVKNLRPAARTDPKQYFNAQWTKLDASLTAIFNNQDVPYSREALYKGAENICRQGYAEELSGKLAERAQSHAVRDLKQVELRDVGKSNIEVLRDVVTAWSTWCKQMV